MSEVAHKRVLVIYELDPDTGEGNGHVHPFCSNECRNEYVAPYGVDSAMGDDPASDWVDGETECETCGNILE